MKSAALFHVVLFMLTGVLIADLIANAGKTSTVVGAIANIWRITLGGLMGN